MTIKRILVSLFTTGFMFMMLAGLPGARADDIDIYLDPVPSTGAEPLVMFSLDMRANTGSTTCSTGAGGEGDPCNFLRVSSSYTYPDGPLVGQTRTFEPYLVPAPVPVKTFTLYNAVLRYVLDRTQGIKVGLMLSHNHQINCAGPRPASPTKAQKCSNGGYILSGFEPVNERPNFDTKIKALTEPTGDDAQAYQGREMFFEYFRFITGQGIYNGHNGWTDRGAKNPPHDYNMDNPNHPAYAQRWDASTSVEKNASTYESPIKDAAACIKLYTVNAMFQVSQQDTDSDDAIKGLKTAGGIGINTTLVTPYSNYTDPFARIVRWLYDTDLADGTFGTAPKLNNKQNVTSYFITASDVNQTRQYAGAGQGLDSGSSQAPYTMSGNPAALARQLKNAFDNILSVSTTFVAPTVAVNVYNRAQVRDDVYIAMFQAPDPYSPAWPGNLKKYVLATNVSSGGREIRDVNGVFAVDAAKGRIKKDALSYWTFPSQLPKAASDEEDFTTGKDGRGVARGGAGSKIPGHALKCVPSNTTDPSCYPGDESPGLTNPTGSITSVSDRKVFYDKPDGTRGDLNADVATATLLHTDLGGTVVGNCTAADALANPSSSCNLLIYARGAEYVENDNNSNNDNVLRGRKWMLGDVLHSRPIAVNYGTLGGYSEAQPNVRLIAGSNDGLMHMFRNTSTAQTTTALAKNPDLSDGVETWAFMPRAVMPAIKKLKTNLNPTDPRHPYTVDGSPTVYIKDVDGDGNIESGDGDKVWLYFGLRRGGNKYYAMDITNPDSPILKWTITGGTENFEELGQTWSTPQIGHMLFDAGSELTVDPKPVLIFGGGYATNKDTHPGHKDADGVAITATQKGSDDNIGNAVFIVNADTGELVWKAVKGDAFTATSNKVFKHPALTDSIPSEITAVDTGGNGLIDRLYFGDTGGRVWRADLKCRNQDGTGCVSECMVDGTPCATAGWKTQPILSVGRHVTDTNNLENDRRFFYPPDFAQSKDDIGPFDAVIIGSGDRENPKDMSVKNWFYMYKDRKTGTGTIPDSFPVVEHGDTQLGDVSDDCLQTSDCTVNLTKGWKMRLHCQLDSINNTCGEKNLSPAVTLSGNIYFTTYIPQSTDPAACSLPEGTGKFYAVSLQKGFAVEDFYSGNGTALAKLDRADDLASGGIPAEVVSLGGGDLLRPDLKVDQTKVQSGLKTFWYEKYFK